MKECLPDWNRKFQQARLNAIPTQQTGGTAFFLVGLTNRTLTTPLQCLPVPATPTPFLPSGGAAAGGMSVSGTSGSDNSLRQDILPGGTHTSSVGSDSRSPSHRGSPALPYSHNGGSQTDPLSLL